MLEVQAHVSERGMKSFELASLFGKIGRDSNGRGVVVARVPRSEIDFYASRILSAGTEVKVESPSELVELTCRKAKEITISTARAVCRTAGQLCKLSALQLFGFWLIAEG